jgi:hypothetical protein
VSHQAAPLPATRLPVRLRELLRLVAGELERLAAEETNLQRREVLLRRVMGKLHEAWPRG